MEIGRGTRQSRLAVLRRMVAFAAHVRHSRRGRPVARGPDADARRQGHHIGKRRFGPCRAATFPQTRSLIPFHRIRLPQCQRHHNPRGWRRVPSRQKHPIRLEIPQQDHGDRRPWHRSALFRRAGIQPRAVPGRGERVDRIPVSAVRRVCAQRLPVHGGQGLQMVEPAAQRAEQAQHHRRRRSGLRHLQHRRCVEEHRIVRPHQT